MFNWIIRDTYKNTWNHLTVRKQISNIELFYKSEMQ